jgi:predicted SnoaL-like aldol condensation-catalyzing enzyme
MKLRTILTLAALTLAACGAAFAQEPVTAVADPDALFTSKDKKLNANKQVVYHIMKDLLEANHWDEADKWLSEKYLQHNPNIASGRAGVVKFFSATRKPTPVPAKMQTKIAFVNAEGDMVTVGWPREYEDPRDASKCYTTTWFDSWKIVNGKADEHWDSATIQPNTKPCKK